MGSQNGAIPADSTGGNRLPVLRIARRPREAGQAPPDTATGDDDDTRTYADTAADPARRPAASARTARTETSGIRGETSTTTTRVTSKERAGQSAKRLVDMANAGAAIIGGPSAAMTVAERGLIESGAVGLAQRNPKRTKQVEDSAAPMALFIGCAMWIGRILKERSAAAKSTPPAAAPSLSENWRANGASVSRETQPEWNPPVAARAVLDETPQPNGAIYEPRTYSPYDSIRAATELT